MTEIIKRRVKEVVIATLKSLLNDETLNYAYLKLKGGNSQIVLKHRKDVLIENIAGEGIMIIPLNTAFYNLVDIHSIESIKVYRLNSSEADVIRFG